MGFEELLGNERQKDNQKRQKDALGKKLFHGSTSDKREATEDLSS